MNHWKEFDQYWLYDVPQGDELWLKIKEKRPSGSTISSCIGPSPFTTIDQAALEISGIVKKQFTNNVKKIMAHGNKVEPFARQWYEKYYQIKINELGFVIPKWNLDIGVSVDGIVGNNGMIEIKGPLKMYYPLKQFMLGNSKNYDHIWKTHYDQMQFGMAILNRQWCDYIVYCTPENSVFCQRILFNQCYWKDEMYPKIKNFIQYKLKPLLKSPPIYPPVKN